MQEADDVAELRSLDDRWAARGPFRLATTVPIGYRTVVLRSVATILLLLQLRPLAGAAICLHQALGASQQCEMARPGTANQHTQAPTSPGTTPIPHADCPLAQLCAVPCGAVLSLTTSTSITTTETATTLPTRTRKLFAAEPAAPLVPPPNL